MATLQIRPAMPPPTPVPSTTSQNHTIIFRHPGYSRDFGEDFLLELHAFDHPDGGLHYATARTACGIVAGNRWDGYFALEPGGEAIAEGDGDVLRAGRDYWFHVPHPEGARTEDLSAPYLYPICPSFSHWQFPHSRLPPSWSSPHYPATQPPTALTLAQSNLSMAIALRDVSCRISNYRDGTESAHICPRKEDVWFRQNAMGTYNQRQNLSGGYLLDDVRNAVLLRRDLHSVFDEGKFVFLPKLSSSNSSSSTQNNTAYVVHFLLPTYNLGALYHNTSLQPIPGIKAEFLLARFAWALFPLLTQFLSHGSDRRLIYVMAMEREGRSRLVSVVKTVGVGESTGFTDGGQRPRSASPRKRKAPGNNDDEAPEPSDSDTYPSHKRPKLPLFPSNTSPSSNTSTLLHVLGPAITREVESATDDLWETITAYPGQSRVEKLREKWLDSQRPEGWNSKKEEIASDRQEFLEWMKVNGVEVFE